MCPAPPSPKGGLRTVTRNSGHGTATSLPARGSAGSSARRIRRRRAALAGLAIAAPAHQRVRHRPASGSTSTTASRSGRTMSRPPAPVAPDWIQADDPRIQGPPPSTTSGGGSSRTPSSTPSSSWPTSRTRTSAPSGPGSSRRGRSRRSPWATSSRRASNSLGLYPYGNLGQEPGTSRYHGLQPELGARLLGQVPPPGRVRQRQLGRLGRELRCRPGDPAGRRGDELRGVPGRPAADQDRAGQPADCRRGSWRSPSGSRGSAPPPASTSEQLRTLMEQTRSSIPALQIVRGQANDRLCILLGEPPRDLEADLGPGAGPGQPADAHDPDLRGGGHPGRPAAPPPRRPRRRAHRSRPRVPRSAWPRPTFTPASPSARSLGQQDIGLLLFENQRRPDVHHAPVLVEHPELRPPGEQRPPPGCPDPGADCDLPEHGPDGGPGGPDGAAGLPPLAGAGRRPGPQRRRRRGGHGDRGAALQHRQGRRESAVHPGDRPVAGAGPARGRPGQHRART